MVIRSSDIKPLIESLKGNSTAILTIGLSLFAVLVLLILLIILDRRKKASARQVEGVQLFDEKKRIRRKKIQPRQQSTVKLFNEEDSSASEVTSQASKDKNPDSEKYKNSTDTIQLFDEKKKSRRKKPNPKKSAEVQLFDEQPHTVAAIPQQPVTVGVPEPKNTVKTQKLSAFPTTLELFPADELDETYSIGNAQHIGKREEQQDSFGVSDAFNDVEVAQKGILAVLADGMGGLENGAESSRNVVSLMLQAFAETDIRENIPAVLQTIVQNVNHHIYTEFNHENTQSMTGSTVVAAILRENLFYWISVGDSRIYLFRNNSLTQLNREHNYGARLDGDVQLGIISSEEAQNDPNRAALTSYIGICDLSEIDRNLEPMQLQPGDRVMMCSDGLFSTLSEAEMVQALAGKPQQAAQELVDRVVQKDRKFQDNVTVIVLGYRV
jgi:protein phosphatase